MKREIKLRNIKLTLEYEGTNYLGWQVQPRGATVQGVIEEKLSLLTGAAARLICAGRTDAGVHAACQVAHFRTESRMPVRSFQKALNSLLPSDIAVLKAEEVGEDFHARRAERKVYEYRILNQRVRRVFSRLYAWHLPQKLDVEAMNEAAQFLVGEHDFSAFRSVGTPTRTAVRAVIRAGWKRRRDGILLFEIEGTGFLKQMVRAIVGTLAEVGRGKIAPDAFHVILESKDRKQAGPTAPPHGLCLKKVIY
jgi:tRNA pseudouridine38-40 synthase